MLAANPVGKWLAATGMESDIVISTRVRLARNLVDVPFIVKASASDQARVVDTVRWALQDSGYLKRGKFIDNEQLTEEQGQFLLERHLVSPDFIEAKTKRGLYVSRDETISLMVNEEDHLRFHALVSGFDFPSAFDVVSKLDERLESQVGYAFSSKFGFLTACPTNVGTGMRASVLVHLPGLVLTKEIEKVLRGAVHIDLVVRGLYGEGTETKGNFFQISNQKTLGRSESEILETVTDSTRQIVDYEHKAREYLIKNLRVEIEDKVFRSFALLKSARILSSDEAINLLATVRLGVSLGIINQVNLSRVSKLLILVLPENLQAMLGERLKLPERDERRATFVRESLVR
ncbi:protein arginine kinase [candidate division WOR-3 bacterium JGI_Cruoil_03_51_56]|uniref:Protein-arginine kinase n=1 Tax=candidate division WOR-3 bacterium JGI_Cruoil_03_51_56 TaxID=1973747 RepID=A0A235BXF8_UNCW3|nr:MAG: protein arginine kinase [candidate division WOR-3 bacterium JGI_Cruoil_03_51_56]